MTSDNFKTNKQLVIVGGGSAGWLTAALFAAHHKSHLAESVQVTLVESSDIPTVGVGEGTWPTMKNTLKSIGIKESDFFRECHAAFKQGGKFANWVKPQDEYYYHPFTFPLGYGNIDLAPYVEDIDKFCEQSNFQHHVCEAGLAPRTLAEQEFQGQCNYAYHLDAGAFANLLKRHSVEKLGVKHMVATVRSVDTDKAGNIVQIHFNEADKAPLAGDIFVDCTGFASLLLGKTLGVPFKPTKDILFNDNAIAVQVPYEDNHAPLATHTIATGQTAGWTWDIGLTSRRGVGYVYSSDFTTEEDALQTLANYLGKDVDSLHPKKIPFTSGHRQQFWKNNCLAIGLAAGFVEPLEATALMLIELSARFLAENWPVDSSMNKLAEKRFNEQMHYRWRRILDFLKLHYILTQRPEDYWQENKRTASMPESLQEDLQLWKYRGPVVGDFNSALELFPAASYQYVIYGMGFRPEFQQQPWLHDMQQQADKILSRNQQITDQMLRTLPRHRDMIQNWLASIH